MFSERPTNFLQQQGKFDDFIDCFNNERPHQALTRQFAEQHYGYREGA